MHCPVCRQDGPFKSYRGRRNAVCKACLAKERQRLMVLVLQDLNFTIRMKVQKVLHIGDSEQCIRNWIRLRGKDKFRFIQCDLRAIPHGDSSIHWILHNHVMEHIKEDRKAFREQFRVLRPGHYMVFTVPIPRNEDGSWVQEDVEFDRKLSKAERIRYYGQEDHERYYGMQGVLDKLAEAGFEAGFLTGRDVGVKPEYAIPAGMGCFIARKPEECDDPQTELPVHTGLDAGGSHGQQHGDLPPEGL